MKNPTLTTVDGPDINYTFSIAPETSNLGTVTDSSSNTATIHAGPANGVSITHNTSFSGNKVNDLVMAAFLIEKAKVMPEDIRKFEKAFTAGVECMRNRKFDRK